MTTEHPITPPPELVKQWVSLACEYEGNETWIDLANQAARWGADQELEWCVSYVDINVSGNKARALRAARRPKPPSLAEEALGALEQIDGWAVSNMNHLSIHDDLVTGVEAIRTALERLKELEGTNG